MSTKSASLFASNKPATSNPFAEQQPAAPAAAAAAPVSSGGVRLTQSDQIGNARVVLDAFGDALTPEQVRRRQFVNKLDQYSRKKTMAIKSPITNGLQECPSTNGKPWKAYKMPNPEFDKVLKDQWIIHRKDYRNRNTPLFCYPDGTFDGVEFKMDESKNPAVDLKMFTYIPQDKAIESLNVFMDLISPENAVSNVERQRAKMTGIIIDFMNNATLQKEKEAEVVKLANMLKTFQAYAGRSEERKVAKTTKKARGLVDLIHAVAIANIGLDGSEQKQNLCRKSRGLPETKKINGVDMMACVPRETFNNIAIDPDFVTTYEKNKVIQELVDYSKKIVKIAESIQPPNWENAFYGLTSEQKRRL